MAELFPQNRRLGFAAITLAAVLAFPPGACAQEDAGAADLVNVKPKVVSKLLIRKDAPSYPAVAKVNFIQGKVQMRIVVSRDGHVSNVHVIKGHPFLAAASIEAVRKWVYRPYRVGKKSFSFATRVSVHFWLRPRDLADVPPSAEQDLQARVDPPKVLDQASDPPTDSHVRLRVLVDSEGHALDWEVLSGNKSDVRTAEQEITQWKFRPAHWGALPVPWYLEVDVPVRHWPA